jgi:hypothetical protein
LLNVSGATTLNNTTINSTLNVSGFTTLSNNTTIKTSLNVVGDIPTSGLPVFTMNSNTNNLNATPTSIFHNFIICAIICFVIIVCVVTIFKLAYLYKSKIHGCFATIPTILCCVLSTILSIMALISIDIVYLCIIVGFVSIVYIVYNIVLFVQF